MRGQGGCLGGPPAAITKAMKPAFLALLLWSARAWGQEVADGPDGAALYKAKCKACHGGDGRGDTKLGRQGKVEDFTSAQWQSAWTDDKLLEVLRTGVKDTKMKSYKDRLTPAELDAVVKHLRTFAP